MIAQFAQAAKIDPAVVAAFIAKAGLGAGQSAGRDSGLGSSAGAELSAGTGPALALKFVKPEVAQGEPLRLEIESFLILSAPAASRA